MQALLESALVEEAAGGAPLDVLLSVSLLAERCHRKKDAYSAVFMVLFASRPLSAHLHLCLCPV